MKQLNLQRGNKMKKIIYGILLLVMISSVLADVDVTIDVATDGEANIYANPNSDGDTNYIIDGVNFDDTINNIDKRFDGRTFDINSVLYVLGSILVDYDYLTRTMEIRDYNELKPKEQKFRTSIDVYIERKLQERDNYYNNIINQLNLEILSIQETIEPEELCNSRLKVSKELSIDSVSCGNITYHNNGKDFIGIEYVGDLEVEIISETHIPQNLTMKNSTIERYQKLCDKGLKKFCRVVETSKS